MTENQNVLTNPSVEQTNIDMMITSFSHNPTEFEIARILYEIGRDTYSCKCFRPNMWINKTDSKIPVDTVKDNLIHELKTTVKNILSDYNNKLPLKSAEHKSISKIIDKLSNDNYINRVIKEATEIFYNN
jgi:hypothetical protein